MTRFKLVLFTVLTGLLISPTISLQAKTHPVSGSRTITDLGGNVVTLRINLLSLGDEEAFSLGINPKATRIAVILLTTTITAASVMVSGIIGWVGLVIPHISRRLVGVNHEQLLPASCLLGAGFMVLVDSVARNLTAAEIPIGILTALIGAPFFGLVYSRMKGES